MYKQLQHKELLQINTLLRKLRKTEAERAGEFIIHFQGTEKCPLIEIVPYAGLALLLTERSESKSDKENS